MGSRRVVSSSDLETEKLAESLLSFVTGDGPSFCESNGENSLHTIDILFGNFCYKKDKLKWVGSLQDLKAFVLTEVDEEIAESTTWRSPSGGTWKFENKVLSVTWQTKSNNIYFEGEKGKEVIERINSFLKQGEADSVEDKVTDAEQIVELITHSSSHTSKQSNVQIDEITIVNGNAMGKHVGITATEYYEKSDGAKVPTPCANVISLDDEVSKLKFKLIQHVDETKMELQQIKENFAVQLDKLRESCCRTGLEYENNRLRMEITQLKEENIALKKNLDNRSCTILDLETELENVENEKQSLITALKLLQDEYNATSSYHSKQSTCSTWPDPKSKEHNRLSARKTSVNHGQNKNVAPNETTTCNQFNILSHSEENNVKLDAVIDGSNELTSPSVTDFSKHNEQERNNQSTKLFNMGKNKASFNDANRTDKNRVSTSRGGESGKLVFIAGDSILQHVHGWELSNAKQRVSVKSFSGSTAEDMKDYLKPLIRKKPDTIILHVGTNDIKDDKKTAEVAAAGILNLGTQIKDNSPHTKVCISGITIRKDKAAIHNKIKNVNNILTRVCDKNKWTYIDNSNVDYTCLNRRGLHLNKKGSATLSKNYSNYLDNQK